LLASYQTGSSLLGFAGPVTIVSKAFFTFDQNDRMVPVAQTWQGAALDNSTWTIGSIGNSAIDASNHF
jgi:hypothetical protein